MLENISRQFFEYALLKYMNESNIRMLVLHPSVYVLLTWNDVQISTGFRLLQFLHNILL